MSFAQYVEDDKIRRLEDEVAELRKQLVNANARVIELEGNAKPVQLNRPRVSTHP